MAPAAQCPTPPAAWPSSASRLPEVPPRGARGTAAEEKKVKRAVAIGAREALLRLIPTLRFGGAFQEEALTTAAVLCHTNELVPADEQTWEVAHEVMRLHSGRDGVQLAACGLVAVLACQPDAKTAAAAALFAGELALLLGRAETHRPPVVTVRRELGVAVSGEMRVVC